MNETAPYPISAFQRAAWRKHNLETLMESASWSFERKVQMLEDMEEVVLGFGYERDPATGRLGKPLGQNAQK